jgi:hypothetical protein
MSRAWYTNQALLTYFGVLKIGGNLVDLAGYSSYTLYKRFSSPIKPPGDGRVQLRSPVRWAGTPWARALAPPVGSNPGSCTQYTKPSTHTPRTRVGGAAPADSVGQNHGRPCGSNAHAM